MGFVIVCIYFLYWNDTNYKTYFIFLKFNLELILLRKNVKNCINNTI